MRNNKNIVNVLPQGCLTGNPRLCSLQRDSLWPLGCHPAATPPIILTEAAAVRCSLWLLLPTLAQVMGWSSMAWCWGSSWYRAWCSLAQWTSLWNCDTVEEPRELKVSLRHQCLCMYTPLSCAGVVESIHAPTAVGSAHVLGGWRERAHIPSTVSLGSCHVSCAVGEHPHTQLSVGVPRRPLAYGSVVRMECVLCWFRL